MVEKEAMRMEVKETSPETLSMAVDFMYGKEIVKGFGDCAGLLELAERFQMADLKKEASERLARIIDQNNYLVMCGLAQKFNAKVLAEGCAKYLLYTTVNVKWDKISKKMPLVTCSYMKLAQETVNVLQSRPQAGPVAEYDFGHKNYNWVYNIIQLGADDKRGPGVDRAWVYAKLENQMSHTDLEEALEFLSSEGHIYTTVDEDHFKTTDE